jgi:hypothetical protein
MTLRKEYNRWINSVSFPPLTPIPEQCKRCHHYETSILVYTTTGYAPMSKDLKDSDYLHFVDGDFCMRFENEEYWDSQKERRIKDCHTFSKREDGVVYIREAAPFICRPWWIG